MTAKEYLSQARSIKILIDAMSEQLAFLKETAKYISPCLSDMPKTPCSIHKIEDACIRVMEKEEQIKEQYNKLDEINTAIYAVSDPIQRAILVKRYLSNKTWAEIAQETFISLRHVQRIHNTALGEITKLLKLGMKCH